MCCSMNISTLNLKGRVTRRFLWMNLLRQEVGQEDNFTDTLRGPPSPVPLYYHITTCRERTGGNRLEKEHLVKMEPWCSSFVRTTDDRGLPSTPG